MSTQCRLERCLEGHAKFQLAVPPAGSTWHCDLFAIAVVSVLHRPIHRHAQSRFRAACPVTGGERELGHGLL